MLRIQNGDFADESVIALLRLHLSRSRAETAPGSARALDLHGLQQPDIRFWTIWDGDMLVGMGALKTLTPEHGEIKSMRTVKAVRRTGVGSAMLRHIVGAARTLGMKRLSLETGSWAYFEGARAFYRKHGFTEFHPYADYVPDRNSVFMTLVI